MPAYRTSRWAVDVVAELSPRVVELFDLADVLTADYADELQKDYPLSNDAVAIVTGLRTVVLAIEGLTIQLAENAERTLSVDACIEDINR